MELTPAYRDAVAQMPGFYDQFLACDLRPASPRTNFPEQAGVYALYDGVLPIYVGRSKNIRQRIGNHIGGRPEQSSFAFRLARETTGRLATYRPQGPRKTLMADQEFSVAFAECVERIRRFQGRFVVIENDILQHLFEVYAAVTLKTPYNEFKTN